MYDNLRPGIRALILPGGAHKKYVGTVCMIDTVPYDSVIIGQHKEVWFKGWICLITAENGRTHFGNNLRGGVPCRYLLPLPKEGDFAMDRQEWLVAQKAI